MNNKATVTGSKFSVFRAVFVSLLLLFLASCEGVEFKDQYPRQRDGKVDPAPSEERATIFGPGGYNLLGSGKGQQDSGGGGGIGVNGYLWRASLDTLSFMPLTSADPFGGVIITDWYSPPETPQERFKMTVYILDRHLRADGLKVAVFRQKLATNNWRDAKVAKKTGIQMENAILQRARQLRLNSLDQ